MSVSLPLHARLDRVLRADEPAKMAKADIRKADIHETYEELGACVDEVRRDAGLTLDEFAYAIGKNNRQVARWIDGTDRPQLEAIFAVRRFQPALVIALARRVRAGIEIVTQITVKKTA